MEDHTLYGVSMMNLPSLETHGRVPCWKKVTCIRKKCRPRSFPTESRKDVCLTWSTSKPKFLCLSKNLRVASSVNGLVIMYHGIGGTKPADNASNMEHGKQTDEIQWKDSCSKPYHHLTELQVFGHAKFSQLEFEKVTFQMEDQYLKQEIKRLYTNLAIDRSA